MSNKQESPEFNAQYIDHLLSGLSAGKAPEVPAEQPMEQPEKCRRTRKQRPHSWILILAATLAAFLVLSLFLPELIAAVGSNRWQATAEEAYSELVGKSSHHFKLHHTVERAGEDRQAYRSENWAWVNNHLYITQESKETVSYELVRNSHHYSKEVTPEDPDAEWVYHGSMIDTKANRPKTLAEANYTFFSVRGTLTGTEVTYLKNESKDAQLTLKFNWDGTLVGITVFRKTNRAPYWKDEYTLLQTDSEEISNKIRDTYKEAIHDKVE